MRKYAGRRLLFVCALTLNVAGQYLSQALINPANQLLGLRCLLLLQKPLLLALQEGVVVGQRNLSLRLFRLPATGHDAGKGIPWLSHQRLRSCARNGRRLDVRLRHRRLLDLLRLILLAELFFLVAGKILSGHGHRAIWQRHRPENTLVSKRQNFSLGLLYFLWLVFLAKLLCFVLGQLLPRHSH